MNGDGLQPLLADVLLTPQPPPQPPDRRSDHHYDGGPNQHQIGEHRPNIPPSSHTRDCLKLASLNMRGRTSSARGFRQEKWFEMYGVISSQRIALLSIQESHLTDELADAISSAYDTKMSLFHSPLPDTRNAAGVAFVVNEALLDSKKVTYRVMIPGRAMIASIAKQAGTTVKVLNVYAPNDPRENETFWTELKIRVLEDPELRPDIMLGDFNLVEDSIDRLPCHPDDASAVAALGELKSELGLVDGWRNANPDRRGYTHIHAPNTSQGRID